MLTWCKSVIGWGVVILTLVACTSCGKAGNDAVLAAYKRTEAAIGANNVTEYRTCVTPESMKFHEDVLRLARTCRERDIKAVDPLQLYLVVMLRNRCDAKTLKTMDYERFLQYMLDEDLIATDESHGYLVHSVTESGDMATVQLGVEKEQTSSGRRVRYGRRGAAASLIGSGISAAINAASPKVEPIPGLECNLSKQGDQWLLDPSRRRQQVSRMLVEEATEAKMSLPEYLLAVEEEEFGSIKKDIWKPIVR